MPQPVSYNPGTPVSGSIQENSISYVVDGQQRNYRGGFGGLSWMSEAPAENNVIFIGNSVSLGRGPANIPLFYPAYNTSQANIVYTANTLPGSPRNFTTSASAYNWAVTNNFFINNSDNPIPRINGDSLGLYIDANQPSSYPQTGTSWYDLSGRNNNGTLTNGPTWNSRGWFTFDGVDDYINFGTTSGGIGGSSEATMELLINMTFPQALQQIFGFRDNSGFDFFFLAFSGGGSEFRARNSAGTYYDLNPSVSSYAGKWTQINFSVGPSGRRVYANGNLIDSSPTWTGNFGSTSPLSLGNYQIGNIWFATGDAANAKLYRKELSQAEIKQNYFQGNIVTSSLSYLWDANNLVSYGKSGTTVYNLTGSISGSLTNGTGYTYNNGGSWVFDGVDDYILLENSLISITPGNGNWTLSAWVKGPWSSGTFYPIVGNTSGGPVASGFAIYQNKIYYQNYDGSWQPHYGNTTLNPNTWYHLTWVNYDGGAPNLGTMKMYINGVADSSVFNSYTTNGGPVNAIGAAYNGIYSGNIASVQWNIGTAFSDQQVAQQYEATKYKFQGQQIVTNGLVLNLDSANKDSYPGTGTTWTDLSTYGDNGTLINGVGFSPNVNNGVLNFDGVDDYVTVSNVYDFGTSNAITAEIWAKSDNATWNDYGYLISRRNQFIIHPQLSSTQVYFYIFAGGYQSVVLTPSSITGFNQYVLTYNNGDLRAYLNGSLGANASVGSPISSYTGDTYIGKDDFLARYLDGSVGAVRLYNRALSATEVLQNYNAQKTRFGL